MVTGYTAVPVNYLGSPASFYTTVNSFLTAQSFACLFRTSTSYRYLLQIDNKASYILLSLLFLVLSKCVSEFYMKWRNDNKTVDGEARKLNPGKDDPCPNHRMTVTYIISLTLTLNE